MHESPLAAAVLDAVLARCGERRVDALTVRVGVAHRAVDEAFEHLFHHVAEGTPAAGARVELVHVPSTYHCDACGSGGTLVDPIPLCPACDAVVEPRGGDELVLESLTYSSGTG